MTAAVWALHVRGGILHDMPRLPVDSGSALKVAVALLANIITNLPEPPLTNLKTIEKPGNRHPPSDLSKIHTSYHLARYNWKTSTEATVTVTARTPCANRAMRLIEFICILRWLKWI
jgi:hypothetical protein